MPRPTDDVTEAELAVLQVLWESRRALSVRELVLAVYGRHEHSLHGGVKSFLDRLLDKGYVTVDKNSFAHTFAPTVSREEYVGRQLKRMADSHFGGAMAPLLLSLVGQVKLSGTDRVAIQKIIDGIAD